LLDARHLLGLNVFMAGLGWLHFSDLHFGTTSSEVDYQTVLRAFLEDLKHLHRRTGDWQLILFTGDLTARGTRDHFAAFEDEFLQPVLGVLARLQKSTPIFFSVPGNHDLERPKFERRDGHLRDLWSFNDEVRDLLWSKEPEHHAPYRTILDTAFKPYLEWKQRWRERNPLPDWVTERVGVLPGDFAATLSWEGSVTGIAGLNSAHLQLSGDDFFQRLDVDVQQLHAATGGHAVDWADKHDVCFLLTHHPEDWLSPSSLLRFRTNVLADGRFAAHLFGHMHEAQTHDESIDGGIARRRIQAPALFSVEPYKGRDGKESPRQIHGYHAMKLESHGDGQASLRIWPRLATRSRDGVVRFGPASTFRLVDEELAEPIQLRLRTPEQQDCPGTLGPRKREERPGSIVPPVETNVVAGHERCLFESRALRQMVLDAAFLLFKQQISQSRKAPPDDPESEGIPWSTLEVGEAAAHFKQVWPSRWGGLERMLHYEFLLIEPHGPELLGVDLHIEHHSMAPLGALLQGLVPELRKSSLLANVKSLPWKGKWTRLHVPVRLDDGMGVADVPHVMGQLMSKTYGPVTDFLKNKGQLKDEAVRDTERQVLLELSLRLESPRHRQLIDELLKL
jgi:predicted MPP superfamily phosphohydrolase